jgi:hypothetical protein
MKPMELLHYKREFTEKAFYYRGQFIDIFNQLEKTVEQYLILHFKAVNPDEFQSVILDRLTFQSKKEAFITVLNNISTGNGFVKTGKNSWPNSNLFKILGEAQDKRNHFAHHYLYVPERKIDAVICLAEFRDNLKVKIYTAKMYNDLLDRIKSATREINLLNNASRTVA